MDMQITPEGKLELTLGLIALAGGQSVWLGLACK
jgi:hypothetical protein